MKAGRAIHPISWVPDFYNQAPGVASLGLRFTKDLIRDLSGCNGCEATARLSKQERRKSNQDVPVFLISLEILDSISV
jgi:hypothetical protein